MLFYLVVAPEDSPVPTKSHLKLSLLLASICALPAVVGAAEDGKENIPIYVAVQQPATTTAAANVLPAIQEIKEQPVATSTIDLTVEPKDLWDRIRNGFSMPDLDNELVTRQQAYYLNHPQYLERVVERSRRYLHFIVEEIEKRGMPMELALLPMVESAFNPMAYSRSRASGLWQFIPSTGRNYQLKQNWWVDERRDIVASTGAALDYLETIYEMHGDWHLALASYNWGEGAVGRAIDKNTAAGLPADYMSLSMPAETRNYVPKLQALKNIIANADALGVSLAPIPNRAYFATVENPQNMDVALAARLAETPLDEFRALNPAFNRPVAAGQAQLVVPADKVETFLSNLESHDKPLVSWGSYTLKRRERLDEVAAQFGISSERLRQINGIKPRARVVAGRTLLVPTSKDAPPIGKPILANLPSADASYEVAIDRDDKPTAKSHRRAGKHKTVAARKNGKRATAAKGTRSNTVARKSGGSASKKVVSSRKQSSAAKSKAKSGTKSSVAAKRNRPSS